MHLLARRCLWKAHTWPHTGSHTNPCSHTYAVPRCAHMFIHSLATTYSHSNTSHTHMFTHYSTTAHTHVFTHLQNTAAHTCSHCDDMCVHVYIVPPCTHVRMVTWRSHTCSHAHGNDTHVRTLAVRCSHRMHAHVLTYAVTAHLRSHART